ncbi:hypothetical protein ACJJIG_16455 [Microbulbifer sp. SSSA007]|uniref:hypothetical protein n=1 Tax=Microbulbifer sp. SSSA007 TaxID=3243379 RepID=UPI00403A5C3F
MRKYFFYVIALFCFSGEIFSAKVAKSDITYIAPWTPFVDVQMGATAIDPEGFGNSNLYIDTMPLFVGSISEIDELL